MADIQVDFIGDDAHAVQQHLRSLVEKYIGPDVMLQGTGVSGTTKTLIALTLSMAIAALFASPYGFFQQLTLKSRQTEFLQALQKFTTAHNIELFMSLPNGGRVDLKTVSVEDLRDLFSRDQ